ncbi:MAG: hypothetical protein JWO16_483 [Sphingomonas bacterium]|nr:hypothetical protein [Sphingomonas bacterium]
MDELQGESISKDRRLGWLKIVFIGMAGYLLGSFFPAGYVRYFIQSKLFPETLSYKEPKFDRAKLQGAALVTPEELTSTFDANPGLLRKKYLDQPVKLSGTIKYFLEGSASSDGLTLTLDTGGEYGTGIIMTFGDPTSPSVTALRKSGPVTAVCLVSGTTSDNVHLNHCEVAK